MFGPVTLTEKSTKNFQKKFVKVKIEVIDPETKKIVRFQYEGTRFYLDAAKAILGVALQDEGGS